MTDPLLTQAWALYSKARFQETNSLLEPQILKYRSDPEFYRILGVSCLRLGDWSGGETYLSRSLQLDPENRIQVELALTAVAMKKRDLSEAVRLCLRVLDQDPRCRPAQKALARLRQAVAAPPGTSTLTTQDWLILLPKASPALNVQVPKPLVRVLVALVLVPAAAFGVWWGSQVVYGSISATAGSGSADQRPGSVLLTGSDPAVPSESLGLSQNRLSLSAEEIRQTLSKVQKLFQDYQDSACRLEINRLILSNASESTKQRVRGLLPYLHAPDFARPEASVSYQDVRGFPELYEGCTVEWKGVISRLNSGTDEITFDLLLGYQEGQVVEGVIPVRLGFASLLKNSQVVDLLGQVAIVDGKWFIEGRGIHAIGYRAP